MHHHNKKQGLSGNEKVLFKGKESGLLKTGKGSYTLLLKQVIKMDRKPLHKSANPAHKEATKATLPPIAN